MTQVWAVLKSLSDSCKYHYGYSKSDCRATSIDGTLKYAVTALYIRESDTKHGTVGRDQWKVNSK